MAGPLHFDVESVSPPQDPEQRLVVYTAEPDSSTARALQLAGFEPLSAGALGGSGLPRR